MKKNLKINILWFVLLLAGYGLITLLASAGVLNDFYLQILQQIGINIILAVGLNLIVGFFRSIFSGTCWIYGNWRLCSCDYWLEISYLSGLLQLWY